MLSQVDIELTHCHIIVLIIIQMAVLYCDIIYRDAYLSVTQNVAVKPA